MLGILFIALRGEPADSATHDNAELFKAVVIFFTAALTAICVAAYLTFNH